MGKAYKQEIGKYLVALALEVFDADEVECVTYNADFFQLAVTNPTINNETIQAVETALEKLAMGKSWPTLNFVNWHVTRKGGLMLSFTRPYAPIL